MKISVSTGAGIFFYKRQNEKLLIALGQRKESPFKGSWSFAGGNFDSSDGDLYSCARREAREEFFHRNSASFESIPGVVWDNGRRITFNFVVFNWHAYFVNVSELDIQFDHHPLEIEAIQWFSIDSLPDKTLPLVRLELFIAKLRGYFS
jgi:8-oxo-dGTP pyrophosphatase MutT (NUDIX family)